MTPPAMAYPPIVHHPDYDAPLPEGHRFPMGKFTALAALLRAEGLVGPAGFAEPEPAGEADLVRAHTDAYVRAVLTQTVAPAMERRIGLPVSAAVARRACAAVGGTMLTARLALQHGLACNTAGGSHHASRDGGAGFCVFNDVAVAALGLLAEGRVRTVAVVDLDVHQGDGTADILGERADVFTLSVHAEKNYPTRKRPGHLDVGLPCRLGDGPYLEAVDAALTELERRFDPDLVFYNAGVDPHEGDALGRLSLTDAGLAARDQLVIGWARRRGVPLAGVLGGGYDADLSRLAARHASLHRAALAAMNARPGG